ncbi:receptor-like cytosolic serine/threonine-protein kinase RBK2 [Bidens hawaiensis]|uniref:receptor-like cytosolic serine/threonine-protein kinase RBK2 n=1 Tax=Bidens hawaiensis TaxID=980011 RepID=UPI0040499835
MYRGYLKDSRSDVFVKRYIGTKCSYVLEAEKKAALTMYHKNILGLYGFHKNENAMALVFPFTSRSGGALLNRFLNGAWTKELEVTFQNKMNIAIGIAQGLRYMHEQCTRGIIVHCDLRPCNVLLGNNFVPQITGFGHAKWLPTDRLSLTRNSCGHMHPSDPSSLTLIKYDVLAFGILLLRLFCKRSAPRDDKTFLPWARSLLAQRAYHILYDESEYDVHGLLVVTSVAERCISTRTTSRPCMSKVLSFLKGEVSCAEQTFPSTESSPNLASTPDFDMWEI